MSSTVPTTMRNAALEHYATNAAARAAVATIPWFGTGIDALLGTAGSNLIAMRQAIYVEELRSALDAVQGRLDKTVVGRGP